MELWWIDTETGTYGKVDDNRIVYSGVDPAILDGEDVIDYFNAHGDTLEAWIESEREGKML